MKSVLLICVTYLACCLASKDESIKKFPDDFLLGVASSSYQIEGAWDEDGKGVSIWDHTVHKAPMIGNATGDVASDSYHNLDRDIEMLRELGVDTYRFSISWSRILPTGFPDHINQAGIDYYNRLINEMLKYNIEPSVTIYHWELPQALQDLGGWTNPLVGQWFEDYARVVFDNFADRVKLWITINEPKEICMQAYVHVVNEPSSYGSGITEYLCAKNLVVAHAKVYHLYDKEYRHKYGAKVGITFSTGWYEPANPNSEADQYLNTLQHQSLIGIFMNPIFGDGGFPKELSEQVAEKSAAQGYPRSRLPEFTDEEKALVRGTYDFMGINHYTGLLVSAENVPQYPSPSLSDDVGANLIQLDWWKPGSAPWFRWMPNSLYKLLKHLHNAYPGVEIYITENGWASDQGTEDDDRVNYIRSALDQALEAVEQGVKLRGYFVWSLMDSFEWGGGYSERFGLYDVDFESPKRTRTPKKSAFVYKQILKTRSLDHHYEPESSVMKIDEGH
ncbi:hypothetical protein JYU34_021521 [Plutella xylostella]|uniref:Myrosinase 1-like n=1 Tax=Plutella xylostella TaxID=51655 RepID=A0ABQ7PTR5_PLUXY|nr:hypothetical protein JYU34_021521 [Plutella xylostella]